MEFEKNTSACGFGFGLQFEHSKYITLIIILKITFYRRVFYSTKVTHETNVSSTNER